MKKLLIDTNIFDELIKLESAKIDVLLDKYRLFTTDVNVKELERIPDMNKREKCLSFLKNHVNIISGKVFTFISYNDSIIEDSTAGFSSYNNTEEGAMLTYDDTTIVTNVGVENNKRGKGTALNDCAYAIQCNRNNDYVPITNDQKLSKKISKSIPNCISWKQLLDTL